MRIPTSLQAGRSFSAAVVAMWIFVIAAGTLPTSTCAAELTAELVLDKSIYLPSDVVTGLVLVTNTSQRDSISFAKRLVEFVVFDPHGEQHRYSHSGRGNHIRLRFAALGPGESVSLPICVAKSDGSFIFSKMGEYSLQAICHLVERNRREILKITSDDVLLTVSGHGSVPAIYVDQLAHLSTICDVFRYGLRTTEGEELFDLDFGPYDESMFAFMTYQMWHVSPRYVVEDKSGAFQLVEGMSARLEDHFRTTSYRGSWIFEGLARMRTANTEKSGSASDPAYVAGDLVYSE